MLIGSALTLLALIVVSFTINPIATLVVVVALVALGVVISPLRRRIRARARSAADAQLSFATTVSELGALGMEMQAFGVRDQFADRVHDAVAADATARRRALVAQGAMQPIYTFLAYGALLGGLALATLLGTGELGGAAAVMLVMMRSLSYGQQVQTSIAALSGSVPYVDMLDDTMQQYAAQRAPGGDRVIDGIGRIEVSSVTFAYHEGHDVLRDISFGIEPGEVVGMIGPSGSGKSTLVQLLLGLREPASGRIAVGGLDLREIERRSWTARTAFVAQEALMVSGTVADNIAFFRDGIDAERIERAARQAHILDEIVAMPNGFATEVGPRGGQLSGGQRQRLSIARALAGDPQLLVMDEPTSALDVRSESLIRRTIADLKGRVTVVIIAHRLSTLEVCDRIMVLQDGEIRAMDTAASLAANDSFYRESLELSGLQLVRTALVTGVAGFIGSTLAERLVADGWSVRGVDRFTAYYEEAIKRSNIAGMLDDPSFELVEADLRTTDLAPVARRHRRRVPRGGAAGHQAVVGRRLRPVQRAQRQRHATAARGGPPPSRRPVRVRIELVRVRRGGAVPDERA